MAKEQSEPVVKKGHTSWKPAAMLDVRHKDPDYTYRWISKDSANVSKKLAEGWALDDKRNDVRPNTVESGSGVGATTEYRDAILARIPNAVAVERNAYYRNIAEEQVRNMKRELASKMARGGAAQPTGKIVIE